MKLTSLISRARARRRGWALLAVMSIAAAGLMLLASVMSWAHQNAATNSRNNEYFTTTYAAEAATEKVLASVSQQYQNYGFSLVTANLSSYAQLLPTSSDSSFFTNYLFSGGSAANRLIVANIASDSTVVMSAPYTGLNMVANTYEIIANAQNTNTQFQIVSTVGQQFYLGTIPLFQFAIFYQNDMEIAPGATMTINGTVHGNQNIYLQPQSPLTFGGNISAVDNIIQGRSPLDPTSRTASTTTFDGFDLTGVDPLNLPIGTNNTGTVSNVSQNAYAILQLPQAGQTPSSSTGSNLLYNQADLIIIISNNNTISVTSGAGVNSQATVITNWQSFMSTNGSFYDQRDSLTVNPVVIDVSNLLTWSASNTTLRSVLSASRGGSNADIQSIYVDDMRGTSNMVVTTNFNTNSTTNVTYPLAGTFQPPVTTNTLSTTNTLIPTAGTYIGSITTNAATTTTVALPGTGTYTGTITTNASTTTTATLPSAGTYTGTITTNASTTTTAGYPGAGTYTGTITTNKSGGVVTGYTYKLISGYSYKLISGYTYKLISGYTYAYITGYTYKVVSTNVVTNWPVVSQPGIVLSNGSVLPPQGLSVATPDPAYIIGNWNVKSNFSGTSDAGTSSTSHTLPSAIYSDAITILSSAWNPANSALPIANRTATGDTVNSAFLTGNVPSNGSYYSGGVENFPRFLENWSGQTFTYNGSMVCMFPSQIATAHWPGGTVYSPPNRTWAFDTNFNTPSKQPHMMPQITSIQRNQWVLLPPRATTF